MANSHQDFCKAFMAALGRGDFDAMAAMMADDFVIREADGLPYGGEYRGSDGWKTLVMKIGATWASVRVEPIEFLGETADTIVLRLSLKGRGRKSGTSFETTVMELWRFHDGRLREIVPYYWDTAHLAAAYSAEAADKAQATVHSAIGG